MPTIVGHLGPSDWGAQMFSELQEAAASVRLSHGSSVRGQRPHPSACSGACLQGGPASFPTTFLGLMSPACPHGCAVTPLALRLPHLPGSQPGDVTREAHGGLCPYRVLHRVGGHREEWRPGGCSPSSEYLLSAPEGIDPFDLCSSLKSCSPFLFLFFSSPALPHETVPAISKYTQRHLAGTSGWL